MTDSTQPRPRSRGRTVWVRRGALILGGLVLAVTLAGAAVIWSIDRSIERVEVEGLGESPPSAIGGDDAMPDPRGVEGAEAITVLVIGSDSREDLTPEEQREYGTGDVEGERAEVLTLARLAPDADEVRLLNLPRDLRVERCDGSIGKINSAYELGEYNGTGGATCTVQTVRGFTGVTIDHVVMVDFGGFVDIVDELGGVTMELDQPLQDDEAHLDLPAGCVELDGVEALAFVRARHLDNDLGRISRQQRFIEELRDELAAVGVFSDLPRLLRVTNAIAGSVELDRSLDLGTLQRLVRQHRTTVQGELEGELVRGEIVTIDGVSYVEPDLERAEELSSWLIDGVDPAEDAEAEVVAADDEPGEAGTDGEADDAASADGADEGEADGIAAGEGPADEPADDAPIGSRTDDRTGSC